MAANSVVPCGRTAPFVSTRLKVPDVSPFEVLVSPLSAAANSAVPCGRTAPFVIRFNVPDDDPVEVVVPSVRAAVNSPGPCGRTAPLPSLVVPVRLNVPDDDPFETVSWFDCWVNVAANCAVPRESFALPPSPIAKACGATTRRTRELIATIVLRCMTAPPFGPMDTQGTCRTAKSPARRGIPRLVNPLHRARRLGTLHVTASRCRPLCNLVHERYPSLR